MANKSKSKKTNREVIAIEAGHADPSVDAIPLNKMTPWQMHEYADSFNWDDTLGPLRRIIRHPKCDLGTALLIFWRAEPQCHYEEMYNGSRDFIEFNGAAYYLLREILAKVQRKHYKRSEMPYDPRNDMGHDNTDQDPPLDKIGFPMFMCDPVHPGRVDPRTR